MKIALAPQYRNWMYALFPTTFGLGTAALWLHSLNWPLRIDEAGVTLRRHRLVNWCSIRKIGVSRSYLDGHVSQIRIHYDGGVCKVPARGLQDGQEVVRIILAMFEYTHPARSDRGAPKLTSEYPLGNCKKRQKSAMPRNPQIGMPAKIQEITEFEDERMTAFVERAREIRDVFPPEAVTALQRANLR